MSLTQYLKNFSRLRTYKDRKKWSAPTFQLPGPDKPIKASGEIVWAKKDVFGVSFKTVSDYLREYFGKIVVQL